MPPAQPGGGANPRNHALAPILAPHALCLRKCAERAVDCLGFPNYPPSDDRVFSAAGVPVVSLGTQDAAGARQMWLAFNGGENNGLAEGFTPQVFRVIHSAEDTMEAVEPATVARAAETYAALIEKLDREIAVR